MKTLEEKKASFRNLLIIALADGFLEQEEKAVMLKQAEEMGLKAEEVKPLFQESENLQFFIPEKQEDREKELKKLIQMMLANDQISPSEYERCLEFARKAKIPREQLDDWIDFFLDRENEYHRILKKNLEEYQKIFDKVLALKIDKENLIELIKNTAEHHIQTDRFQKADQKTLIRFLWLIFYRALSLNKSFLNQIPMYCSLIREGRYEWRHFFSALILNEKSHCNGPIHVNSVDTEQLKKDIQKFISAT